MLVFRTTIVGAHFRGGNAKTICGMLRQGDTVPLEREPDNKYDPNAVKAVVDGDHIGYISAKDGTAAAIAPYLDEAEDYENHTVVCRVIGHEKIDMPAVAVIVYSEDEADEVESAFASIVESSTPPEAA